MAYTIIESVEYSDFQGEKIRIPVINLDYRKALGDTINTTTTSGFKTVTSWRMVNPFDIMKFTSEIKNFIFVELGNMSAAQVSRNGKVMYRFPLRTDPSVVNQVYFTCGYNKREEGTYTTDYPWGGSITMGFSSLWSNLNIDDPTSAKNISTSEPSTPPTSQRNRRGQASPQIGYRALDWQKTTNYQTDPFVSSDKAITTRINAIALCLVCAIYEEKPYIGFVTLSGYYEANREGSSGPYLKPNNIKYIDGFTSSLYQFEYWSGVTYPLIEPDPVTPDPSGDGGYRPNPDPTSDLIPVPPKPSLSISDYGFLNVYKMSQNGLQGMVDEIFPELNIDPIPTDPTIQQTIKALSDSVLQFSTNFANTNILNYVTDVHIIPVSPETENSTSVKVGYKTLETTGLKVTNDYVDFDCGTLSLDEFYGNFLDYSGTKADLYLPFIGNVSIKPEYFQGGQLHIVYRFNVIDGSCIAFVLSTSSKSSLYQSVIGSYTGSCCIHMPIYGRDFATLLSQSIGSTMGASPFPVVRDFANSLGEGTSSTLSKIPVVGSAMKSDTPSTNGYNSSTSYCGIRYPYLIISRLKPSWAENFKEEKGLTLNVTKKLSDCHGFTQTDSSVHVDSIPCTENEQTMIHDLLSNGVILP